MTHAKHEDRDRGKGGQQANTRTIKYKLKYSQWKSQPWDDDNQSNTVVVVQIKKKIVKNKYR